MDKILQTAIDRAISNMNASGPIKVLDVGCGTSSQITLPGNAYIVGIDISQEQLQTNAQLNERICGDIQNVNLESPNFDVAVAWFVLEHLQSVDKALTNILKALRKGGVIIIGVPYYFSALSLLTKITPLWFHMIACKHIFIHEKVRTGAGLIFKTFLRFSISPRALRNFASKNNLSIEYHDLWKNKLNFKNKFYKSLWLIFISMLKLFSLGRISETGQYFLILKKQKD
jgi:ubiquinone/menaquinone biosynthesis C-methylase UbiE